MLKVVSDIVKSKKDDGHAVTGCLQHEEICRDEDFMGITFADKKTPSQMVHDWMAGMSVREVDVRWPNSASCWRGDHGFC